MPVTCYLLAGPHSMDSPTNANVIDCVSKRATEINIQNLCAPLECLAFPLNFDWASVYLHEAGGCEKLEIFPPERKEFSLKVNDIQIIYMHTHLLLSRIA